MGDQSKYNAYKNEFRTKNYDTILLTVKKGQRDILKQRAADKGLSLNGYLNDLIEKDRDED